MWSPGVRGETGKWVWVERQGRLVAGRGPGWGT